MKTQQTALPGRNTGALTTQERAQLRSIQGQLHSHESLGTVDGPGIRQVFFLQGCPLRCLYCHNPDSVPTTGGERWTAGDVVDEAMKYSRFLKKGGVTLSGGEPLRQLDFVVAILKLLAEQGVHTAIDTSGCYPPAKVQEALDWASLILLDIKAAEEEVALRLTGAGVANAFATLDYCEAQQKPVWIRHVIVQGYTLDEKQLEPLARRLATYRCVERVELLPFHKMGEYKWEAMGRNYALQDTPATSQEQMKAVCAIFERQGLAVQ